MKQKNFSERFYIFADKLQEHVNTITKATKTLFVTDVTKEELWNTYLDSFPEGTNPIFKERREFDCVCCKQFIRKCGNIVAIKDGKELITIWDIEDLEYPYNIVAESLSELVKSRTIKDVFVTHDNTFGVKSNKQLLDDGNIVTWDHFYMEIPKDFAIKKYVTVDTIMNDFRTSKEVFERSLKELSLDAAKTVLEIIDQGSLYRGEEQRTALNTFIKYKKMFDIAYFTDSEKDIWLWANSIKNPITRIRNSALGTILIDLSEGVSVDAAVRKWEKVMAPANYKRPKPIFTKKMIEAAEKKIKELGYMESLGRRYAVLEDITVNNVLFVNRDAKKKMEGGTLFDVLKEESDIVNPKSFSKVEEIHIKDFIDNVVPHSKRIELLVENRHQSNLMSLIAPLNKEAPSMFKWDNAFSWSYCNDAADSELRKQVINAGGRVDGCLRFSHSWNHTGQNQSLMDLHVFIPGTNYPSERYEGNEEIHNKYPLGPRIGWNRRNDPLTKGVQDVDFINPPGKNIPVENITFPDINKMPEGTYYFKIHNWSLRNPTTTGFKAEIECNGIVYSYEYDKPLKRKEWITVATAELKDGVFTVNNILPESTKAKPFWGISSNKWVEVSTLMFSPNYWDGQTGVGNRHYLFFLKDCQNEGSPRGFFNEYLKPELLKHRKVFEALGNKSRVENNDAQLSGLGFSDTQRNSIYVKVEGSFTRILKINF